MYGGEFVQVCKIVSEAISCYMSNSLLFVPLLPSNDGPDRISVFLGKVFEMFAAALFVLVWANKGFMYCVAGFSIAMLLPFTQDIRVSFPGLTAGATLFLPTAAMLSVLIPYEMALYALTYFTLCSLAGLPACLVQVSSQHALATLPLRSLFRGRIMTGHAF